jgi:hypothetical protein
MNQKDVLRAEQRDLSLRELSAAERHLTRQIEQIHEINYQGLLNEALEALTEDLCLIRQRKLHLDQDAYETLKKRDGSSPFRLSDALEAIRHVRSGVTLTTEEVK